MHLASYVTSWLPADDVGTKASHFTLTYSPPMSVTCTFVTPAAVTQHNTIRPINVYDDADDDDCKGTTTYLSSDVYWNIIKKSLPMSAYNSQHLTADSATLKKISYAFCRSFCGKQN